MSDGSGDIIIKAGSVNLIYDESVYPKDPRDPKSHLAATKKVTRIVITGEISFDSGDYPQGLQCQITTTCK
jgi:hypothetical protein